MSSSSRSEVAFGSLRDIEGSLEALDDPSPASLSISGTGSLPSVFATTDLAVASVAAAGRAALAVLGIDDDPTDPADRETVTTAVAGWTADELESAIVAAGGCAAEPLIHVERFDGGAGGAAEPSPVTSSRPLAGVRVLDLTRASSPT